MKQDTFGTYHPIINFGFFCIIIIFSMIFMHPAFLVISFIGSFMYAIYIKGKKALKFFLCLPLPMMAVAAAVNPLFNHQGVTILGYLNDNPVTMESIAYGIATGLMFSAVIMWFYCYNEIMTSDKSMYIFGRAIPSISLMISMALRFIPRFAAQTKLVAKAQRCIGRDTSSGKVFAKIKQGMKILSIMVTWSLENAIDTADSMRSRGYGSKGRTSYSNYRFDSRDRTAGMLIAAFTAVIIAGAAAGYNTAVYFPVMEIQGGGAELAVLSAVYAILCLMPVIAGAKEDMKWRHLKSEI
ncbi:MAG: energy-coupling factor transporter transmembrane component T [Eubacteriaceae bacterium]|nr:energy-coupling factor transporter transmembrane component T [Eubacteriaceae bacterium]